MSPKYPSEKHYLNPAQQHWVESLRQTVLWRLELPTWVLIAVIYSGWFGIALFWESLNIWLATPIWIFLTTWYLSLQHELIHGHPTRFKRLNQLIGTAPLAVWYPYGVYRDSHLAHHIDENLTIPGFDPESYYLSAQGFQASSPLKKNFARLCNTFIGRMVFGPAVAIVKTLTDAFKKFSALDLPTIAMWLIHLGLLIGLLAFLKQRGVHPIYFIAAVAYPALSLAMVRSFYEHRADSSVSARSVVNEAGWLWRVLFLNLNYHIVHHDLPSVPWYSLRTLYMRHRDEYRARVQGFVLSGYTALAHDYAYRAVIKTVHPLAGFNGFNPTDLTNTSRSQSAANPITNF